MAHFTHLKVKESKGLKQALLCDLRKINVLCGPNNSGKTTILECMCNEKNHAYGRAFDSEDVDRLYQKQMENLRWTNSSNEASYIRILRNTFDRRAIWFSDDLGKLDESIAGQFWEDVGNQHQIPGNLGVAYRSFFQEKFSVAMIPAKRRLDATAAVNSSETVQPLGHGLLNFLFRSKNQSNPARSRFDRILAGFAEITNGFAFDVFLHDSNRLELFFKSNVGDWVKGDDCGLGLRDLLIMLYFGVASDYEVVLVEEPENHIHPDLQRRLISFLKRDSAKQFFFSTHSSVFLNTQFADRIFLCKCADQVTVDNATSQAQVLTELGYSIADNLVSDLVILTEGPSDKPVLEEFLGKMGLSQRYNIKIWPLGGDIMAQIDLSVFSQSYQVIALIDQDPGSANCRRRFRENCEQHGIWVQQLQRYALENYYSVPAIAAVMKGQMPAGITSLNPDISVRQQLNFDVKKNGQRIAQHMTLDDIKGTDLEAFLLKAKELCA